jgi:hypothetical protein
VFLPARAFYRQAMFTRDEQVAFFKPEAGRFVENEARWKARQNVILEAA